MKLSSAIGGLAGACALTIINQLAAKVDRRAPRLDLLGMNALAKLIKGPNSAPLLVRKLLPMSLAGDLVSNSMYYALAGSKSKNTTLVKGLLLGLGAGLGAVTLPKPLGLDESTTNRTQMTQGLTIAWYIIGGLVAAAVINALDEDQPVTTEIKGKVKKQIKQQHLASVL